MSTYVPIQAITLTADTATVDFTGIPQTFTDLVIVTSVANNQTSTSSIGTRIQVGNNTIDTGSNYSSTLLAGEGTGAATSGRISSSTYSSVGEILGTTGRLFPQTIQIMNYSNTTTHKTIFSRSGTSSRAEIVSSLWRSTSAINQIRFTLNSNSYVAGSTFTLYGIGVGSPKAFGGNTVTTDGTYWYHTFRSSGLFIPTTNLTNVDYLVVAGGGGGGPVYYAPGGQIGAAGGGAGGMRCTVTATGGGGSIESALSLLANTNYTVTIGSGGSGGVGSTQTVPTNGSNSVFSTITSTGGGYGGYPFNTTYNVGANGGSGGGGIYGYAFGNGTSGQGYAGGTGSTVANAYGAGGGGGAGAVGGNGNSTNGGNGGNGVATSISGSSVTYAGGGGGGSYINSGGGSGGTGGGGAGGIRDAVAGGAGTANTGSGGGGAGGPNPSNASNGGNGGSGIVIVRYAV